MASFRWTRSRFWYDVFGRAFWTGFFHVYAGFSVQGAEHWRPGPLIVVSNHRSSWDPFPIVTSCPYRVCFLAKVESFRNPIARYFIRQWGSFPIVRGGNDVRSLRLVMHLLRAGEILGMFPEGTRSRDGKLGEFHPGAAKLAIATRTPVLPVALFNTDRLKPIGAVLPRPRVGVRVAIGEPFELSDYYGARLTDESLAAATAEIRSRVARLLQAGR